MKAFQQVINEVFSPAARPSPGQLHAGGHHSDTYGEEKNHVCAEETETFIRPFHR